MKRKKRKITKKKERNHTKNKQATKEIKNEK